MSGGKSKPRKARKRACENCDELRPVAEGKWGRYCGMWICDVCRAEWRKEHPEEEDDEEWYGEE